MIGLSIPDTPTSKTNHKRPYSLTEDLADLKIQTGNVGTNEF